MMRPSAWADRLMALSVRFVGLVIMLAALVAAVASFFYNKAQEVDQAARVAMQVDTRLRDQLGVLEGVRALYQSDNAESGFAVRSYLAALQPRARPRDAGQPHRERVAPPDPGHPRATGARRRSGTERRA